MEEWTNRWELSLSSKQRNPIPAKNTWWQDSPLAKTWSTLCNLAKVILLPSAEKAFCHWRPVWIISWCHLKQVVDGSPKESMGEYMGRLVHLLGSSSHASFWWTHAQVVNHVTIVDNCSLYSWMLSLVLQYRTQMFIVHLQSRLKLPTSNQITNDQLIMSGTMLQRPQVFSRRFRRSYEDCTASV